jgi:isocitrate dehydrogenase
MSTFKISVAKGDGIGPEIMDAVLSIFDAAKVPLTYEFIDMGKAHFEQGFSTGMTDEAKASVERNGLLFKGPMETPKGKGMKSINVTARKVWSTFANRRHFKSLHGVDTVFSKAGIPIDITIVRENIEDTYGGVEHMLTRDVAMGRRFISRQGSEQVVRFAFEMAKKEGIKKVACGHKANIMKLTDGMFLDTFYKVAAEYPEVKASDIIVDDLAMKLVVKPQDFQVVVLPNLQGDIISDLCAGLVGGLGFAPSANIGENICIFEAVHGTAPDIAGQNIANPTSLLLSGLMMLRHLGLMEPASVIENALLYTLEQGVHTGDFGDKSIPSKNTTDFASIIIENFGMAPKKGKAKELTNTASLFKAPQMPDTQKMMSSPKTEKESVVGMDLFIESELLANEIAELIKPKLRQGFKLVNISNRGTQVWPTGSNFTECVNSYCLRFEARKDAVLEEADMYAFATVLSSRISICSVEILKVMGDKKSYSLAQGQ